MTKLRTVSGLALLGGLAVSALAGLSVHPGKGAGHAAAAALPGTRPEDVALATLAAREGLDPRTLRVIKSSPGSYPLQAVTTIAIKAVGGDGHSTYGIEVDAAGKQVDPARLLSQERALRISRYGKIDSSLFDRLGSIPGASAIPVTIWMKEPAYSPPPRGNIQPGVAPVAGISRDELVSHRRQFVASLTAGVVERLKGLGVAGSADSTVPVIQAALLPSQIREVAAWDAIDAIGDTAFPNRPYLQYAVPNVHGDIVRARGVTGTGVTLGVIEMGGAAHFPNVIQVASHPNIAPASILNNPANGCVGNHTNAVVGALLANNVNGNLNLGIAQGISLWIGGSCGDDTATLENQASAAVANNAQILNMSWGHAGAVTVGPDAVAKFFDSLAINSYTLSVVAAGDEGNLTQGTGALCYSHMYCSACAYNVGSPGSGYNVLTVGAYSQDLRNGGTSWASNHVWACSSDVPPSSTHNDRVKPEVSAPGDTISAPNASNSFGSVSGTSFSAPLVAGIAALAIQRDGLTNPPVGTLGSWPEALRAIIMATATDDITNGSAYGDSRLSLDDGAGGVVADQVDNVVKNRQWGTQSFSSNCATLVNTWFTLGSMGIASGARTRIAMAWDSDPADANYGSQPSADLDLWVYRTDVNPAQLIDISASYDNTYEIVEFTPTATGTYTAYAYGYRCDTSPRWLGWAWVNGFATR